jgi:cytochrome c-type biogenesis protein CcmE
VAEFSAIDQPFRVNGVPVQTTATTQYEGGLPGDVANGARLEVEGVLDADGILVAEKVELEDGSGDDGDGS